MKIVALNFSEEARKKLLNSKCDLLTIDEEIKKNPDNFTPWFKIALKKMNQFA